MSSSFSSSVTQHHAPSTSTSTPPLHPPPQVTVLVVDQEYAAEAAVICALLGDEHKLRSQQSSSFTRSSNVVRVVTNQPNIFLSSVSTSTETENTAATSSTSSTTTKNNKKNTTRRTQKTQHPYSWRCHEKLPQFGNRWVTHFAPPDGVYSMKEIERVLMGNDTYDDGGKVDLILLCGISSLVLLQQVATAISSMSEVLSCCGYWTPLKPLVISSIGSFRTLDWLTRRVVWDNYFCHPPGTSQHHHTRCESSSPQPSSHILPLAFCAFPSPLLYCRMIRPGLVLFQTRNQSSLGYAPLIVRPSRSSSLWCHQLWNPILQSTHQRHTTMSFGDEALLDLEMMFPRQQRLGHPSNTAPIISSWQGAVMLFYHLQDPTMILFPCFAVATWSSLRHQYHNEDHHDGPAKTNRNPKSKTVGKLALDMVVEIYRFYHSLSQKYLPTEAWNAFVIQHDTLLADIVASPIWIAFSNNTTLEIMNRLSSRQQTSRKQQQQQQQHRNSRKSPIRHIKWIESIITRQAHTVWDMATSGSPAELANRSSRRRDKQQKFPKEVHESLCHGLLWMLEIGQLMGGGGGGGDKSGVEQEFSTTLYVVRQLQSILPSRPLYILDHHRFATTDVNGGSGTVVWNDNAMMAVGAESPSIVSTRVLGITSGDQLLACLATDSTEVYRQNMPSILSLRSSL